MGGSARSSAYEAGDSRHSPFQLLLSRVAVFQLRGYTRWTDGNERLPFQTNTALRGACTLHVASPRDFGHGPDTGSSSAGNVHLTG
jgi:hypothetical protein